MNKPTHPAIRTLLRARPDGLRIEEMAEALGLQPKTLRRALVGMPDAYLDRWVKGARGQWNAVWCVVVPPQNCPHPKERYPIYTQWRHRTGESQGAQA
jgi:hypothetical protein